MNPRVDDLETRHHVFGGGQHVGFGDAGADQVMLELEGDLALGTGLDQFVGGQGNLRIVIERHLPRDKTEIRLMHVKHLLHRRRGHADFLADDLVTGRHPTLNGVQGNVIGIFDADRRPTLGQRRQGGAAEQRLIKLFAELTAQLHAHPRAS
ncbi:hypothetical protein D3C78_1387190 [compost metagenome]